MIYRPGGDLQSYIGPVDPNSQQFQAAIQRRLGIAPGRTRPVRGLTVQNNTLVWNPPQQRAGITHYRIYVNNENNLVRVVSAGQTQFADPTISGTTFFVTSFNANNGAESAKSVYGPLASAITLVGAPRFYFIGTMAAGLYAPDVTKGVFHQVTLTANVTIKPPANATRPVLLSLILVQDATGGRTVTWDAAYRGVANYGVDGTASTYSVFRFVLRSADLVPVLISRPLTDLVW